MVGAAGTWVSMVTEKAVDATLVCPDETSVAVRLWVPSPRTGVVRLQWPVASTATVPISFLPSKTSTVLLATAVPVNVGVLSLVMWSPMTPVSGENEVIVGAAGGVGVDGGI